MAGKSSLDELLFCYMLSAPQMCHMLSLRLAAMAVPINCLAANGLCLETHWQHIKVCFHARGAKWT